MSAKATKNSIIIATCIEIVAVILTTSLILSGVVFRSALAATSYTITYDANGGTLTGSSSVSATAGSTITLPNVSKVGYSAKWIDQTAPSGTAITTASQLAGISSSGTYYLANDIDLSGYSSWTPISSFSGTLDGRGFAIKNLKITSGSAKVGLFAQISGATIKNIVLENVNINVSSSAQNFGGLVAKITSSSNIVNCKTSGVITVSTSNSWGILGGICGQMYGNSNIKNCTNGISITLTSSGNYTYVGGIVGQAYLGASAIVNSINLGNVKSTGGTSRCGGILGVMYTPSGASEKLIDIDNCYNKGKIDSSTYSGGIVGYNSNGSVVLDINNCFNSGNVGSKSIIGNGDATLNNCYYLSGTSGTAQGTAVSTVSDLASKFYNNMSSDDKAVWNYTTGSYPTIKVFDFNLSGNIGDKKFLQGTLVIP